MRKYYISLILLISLYSCTPPLKMQVSLSGSEPVEYSQRIVYSLPRTLFKVNINLEKDTYMPGPYYQFTERFLGLEDYIREYGIQYRITGVELESFTEPDPDQFYSVSIQEGSFNWEKYLIFTEKGFVLDPAQMVNYRVREDRGGLLPAGPYFSDQSTRMNLREITDTLYKTVVTDTSLIRLPVITTAREVRTIEQKAEEAARNLFTIRENRFFLITNTEGDYPDGKTLEIMIAEMDKMEQSYLELFTGKTVTRKYEASFVVPPDDSDEVQTKSLGTFSAVSGLNSQDAGLPLNLEITPLNNLDEVDGSTDVTYKGEPILNQLFYRIPDQALVRILIADEVLFEGRVNVFQYGPVINLPVVE